MTAFGLGQEFGLWWQASPVDLGPETTVMQAVGNILVNIVDPGYIESEVRLRVHSYGRPIKSFRLRLPPGATYFIIVIALSSGIDAVGVAPLTLHLFVVFFAVISTVTPPVALAAFAAAPIAGADPVRTGFQAARLSLAGFLIPFVFVYHPAVLYKLQILFEWFGDELPTSRAMIDISTVGWGDLGWIVIAFAGSMWMLTSALTGYEKNRLHGLERLARVVAGIAVLMPDMTIAGPGLAASAALIVGHRFLKGDRSPVDIPST